MVVSKKSALQRVGSRRVLPLISEEERCIESVRWTARDPAHLLDGIHPPPAAKLKTALLYHDEAFSLAWIESLSVALPVHMYNVPR